MKNNSKKYSITLADGTIIDNLSLNGNNFVSEVPIDSSIFDYNLDNVIISDGITNKEFKNMELVQIMQMNDKYLFILRELSAREISDLKLRSDIDYLAMMLDVEL